MVAQVVNAELADGKYFHAKGTLLVVRVACLCLGDDGEGRLCAVVGRSGRSPGLAVRGSAQHAAPDAGPTELMVRRCAGVVKLAKGGALLKLDQAPSCTRMPCFPGVCLYFRNQLFSIACAHWLPLYISSTLSSSLSVSVSPCLCLSVFTSRR